MKPLTDHELLRLRKRQHGNVTALVHRLADEVMAAGNRKVLIVVEGGALKVLATAGVEVEVLESVRHGYFGEVRWQGVPQVSVEPAWTANDWLRLSIKCWDEYVMQDMTERLAKSGRWDLWERKRP